MKPKIVLAATIGLVFAVQTLQAQVTKVEAGHTLKKIVDSAMPLHPSQAQLDTVGVGDIESIGIDPSTGNLYTQLSSGGYTSITSDIFRITPAGIVTPVAQNTGFGINSRGTDLHFDPNTGLLVTLDQNFNSSAGRIATVAPATGVLGTWATLAPGLFLGATLGMDFSAGIGDVPAGEILFTGDVQANGMYSAPLGGPVTTHPPIPPPAGGDDLVIQPDGDWVHVGDFTRPLTAYNAAGPHPHATTTSPLNIQTMFTNAGLPFVHGSRATVCDSTGELYLTYSGIPGGPGLFRVNEPLTAATLVLTVGGTPQTEGVHDLTLGPSGSGFGTSVYFTVHDISSGGEEVWELTAPCGTVRIDLKPGSNPNCVNPASRGRVSVAILTSPSLDATQVNPGAVWFGGALAERCAVEDVDVDADLDLVCKFKTQDVIAWPSAGSDCETVALAAYLLNGSYIEGVDIACLAGETTCNAGTPTPVP